MDKECDKPKCKAFGSRKKHLNVSENSCNYKQSWIEHGASPMKCVMDVGKNMKRLMEQRLSQTGLTPIQSRILGYIFVEETMGNYVFQRDIEELFRIRRSSVTSVLQLLEKKGLLRRESVEEDARMKKLVLTEEGWKLQKCTFYHLDTLEQEIRSIFSDEELKIFFGYMNRIDEKILNLYHSEEETND